MVSRGSKVVVDGDDKGVKASTLVAHLPGSNPAPNLYSSKTINLAPSPTNLPRLMGRSGPKVTNPPITL